MKVFAFEYCPCVCEGGFEVISLHFTKAAAYTAMRQKKLADYEEWCRYYKCKGDDKFPEWTQYRIREMEVK